MERLTEPGFNFTSDYVASHLQSYPIAQALAKLQAYEDSGLTPDYVQEIGEAMKEGRVSIITKAQRAADLAQIEEMYRIERLAMCRTCENNGWSMPQCLHCNKENGFKWHTPKST